MIRYSQEFRQRERFQFGRNWRRFLTVLDEDRIARAERSLTDMLGMEGLEGKRFLDIGCGSGLFSLAARRLGATVYSFDYDPQSVACALDLKLRYFPVDPDWVVEEGSVLNHRHLTTLGKFDIVYAWGVLHHTGDMAAALKNVCDLVAPKGKLFLAIYNDQGRASRRWAWVKRANNRLPRKWRFLVLWPAFLRLWGPTFVRDLITGRPFQSWRTYRADRGMSPWRDVIDWVGGHPFEVAKPEKIFDFYHARGFVLYRLKTCGGGHGCNEYVFTKVE